MSYQAPEIKNNAANINLAGTTPGNNILREGGSNVDDYFLLNSFNQTTGSQRVWGFEGLDTFNIEYTAAEDLQNITIDKKIGINFQVDKLQQLVNILTEEEEEIEDTELKNINERRSTQIATIERINDDLEKVETDRVDAETVHFIASTAIDYAAVAATGASIAWDFVDAADFAIQTAQFAAHLINDIALMEKEKSFAERESELEDEREELDKQMLTDLMKEYELNKQEKIDRKAHRDKIIANAKQFFTDNQQGWGDVDFSLNLNIPIIQTRTMVEIMDFQPGIDVIYLPRLSETDNDSYVFNVVSTAMPGLPSAIEVSYKNQSNQSTTFLRIHFHRDFYSDVFGPNTMGADKFLASLFFQNDGPSVIGKTNQTLIKPIQGHPTTTGTIVNDVIEVGSRNQEQKPIKIFALSGDDLIYGHNGIDEIDGGPGDDLIIPFLGRDIINGSQGIDKVSYYTTNTSVNLKVVNTQNETLNIPKEIIGLISVESIETTEKNDKVDFSSYTSSQSGNIKTPILLKTFGGNDTLIGSIKEVNTFFGHTGNDSLKGGNFGDVLNGNEGNDFISGEDGNDTLVGGAGVDTFNGGQGFDILDEENNPNNPTRGITIDLGANGFLRDAFLNIDQIVLGTIELFMGTSGNDNMKGHGGNSIDPRFDADFYGQAGNDTLTGSGLDQVLDGGDGNDSILGLSGNDTLIGWIGNDSLDGGANNDSLDGQEGNDSLNGREDNDSLNGREGNDSVFGGTGVDSLFGGSGNDMLQGDQSNDWLQGGEGNDTLFGGEGSDTFYFSNISEGIDHIRGFGNGDTIRVSRSGFTGGNINSFSYNNSSKTLLFNNQPFATFENTPPYIVGVSIQNNDYILTPNSNFFQRQRWATGQGSYLDSQDWLVGNFNGSGGVDLAKNFIEGGQNSIDIHIADAPNNRFNMTRGITRAGSQITNEKFLSGDFNQDGRDDIAKIFSWDGKDNIDVYRSNGSSFTMERWATARGSTMEVQQFVAGDFNGDGRDDISKIFSWDNVNNIDVYRSNGSSFTMERWATNIGRTMGGQQLVAGDFNGDGRDDIANIFSVGGVDNIDVHRSNGSSFSMNRWATAMGATIGGQQFVVGDFNGDGRDDIAKVYGINGNAVADIYESFAGSFRHYGSLNIGGGSYLASQKWFAGDFNGDGRDDLSKVFGQGTLASIDVHVNLQTPNVNVV